jgi:hypothetical protein
MGMTKSQEAARTRYVKKTSGGFAADVERFLDKTVNTMDEMTKELLVLIMVRIDERSPIGNPRFWKYPAPPGYKPGLFRGSWMLGVDSINEKKPNTRDPSRAKNAGGMLAVARAMKKIPQDAAGHVYYYSNNVPYAIRLEYGWSVRQSPYGIVGVTRTEFHMHLKTALKKAKYRVTG